MGFKVQMVGLLYLLVPIIESAIVLDSATIDTAWYHYKVHFNKDYDEVREMTRKPAFLKSLRYVITKNLEHDLTGHWYMAGLNAVADFTTEELHCVKSPTYNADVESSVSGEISANAEKSPNFNNVELSTSDLRKDVYGIVTGRSVQDGETGWLCCFGKKVKKCPKQKNWVDDDRVFKVGCQQCGDCYAWAATYALSSAWAIKSKKSALDLSVQQAKDCSYHIYNNNNISFNNGCEGGDPYYVYEGINKTQNKMVQTKDYSNYNGYNVSLSCKTAQVIKSKAEGATIKTHDYLRYPSDCDLVKELQKGPVTADMCMSLNLNLWISGTGTGLYSNFNCTVECQSEMQNKTVHDINHSVLIVGYTPTSWIIQNSYGAHWAYKGIGHLARDENQTRICNLAREIQWPIV